MLRLTSKWLLKVETTSFTTHTERVAGGVKRKRQFVYNNNNNNNNNRKSNSNSNRRANTDRRHSIPPARGVATPLYEGQRQRYRHFQQGQPDTYVVDEVAGSTLTPLPPKYNLYDGMDEHALGPSPVSREERRQRMQRSLEEQAASVVDFTEGGESDIEMNGLPPEEFHGQEGWTTIPKDSAMYSAMFSRGELESRQRHSSWTVARRNQKKKESAEGDGKEAVEEPVLFHMDGQLPDALTDERRRRLHNEGDYSDTLEGELLEPLTEMVGQPRSVYGMRKMYVNGLVGYQGVITRAEEAQICEELMQLLQDPRAAYIAEETRYCVNLYEKELGIPGRDSLAFSLARAPTLQRVLFRFFFLGLIPSPPNVCQISEMIGNFSGYPVHRKPPSIGSYCGMLNLVSTSVLHLQHRSCPWYPRLHLSPRALYVVTEPCLQEYLMGYKRTHQPFHTFEYATRVSKDYRIEVLFATVEVEHTRHLHQAVQLTEYAEQKQQQALTEGSNCSMNNNNNSNTAGAPAKTDMWLRKLRDQLHTTTEGTATTGSTSDRYASDVTHVGGEGDMTPIDGNKLREALLQKKVIGSRTKTFSEGEEAVTTEGSTRARGTAQSRSASQRRLAALKQRHNAAQNMQQRRQGMEPSSEGHRLIRGSAPGDPRPS